MWRRIILCQPEGMTSVAVSSGERVSKKSLGRHFLRQNTTSCEDFRTVRVMTVVVVVRRGPNKPPRDVFDLGSWPGSTLPRLRPTHRPTIGFSRRLLFRRVHVNSCWFLLVCSDFGQTKSDCTVWTATSFFRRHELVLKEFLATLPQVVHKTDGLTSYVLMHHGESHGLS